MDDWETLSPRCYLPRRYLIGAMSFCVLTLAYNIRVGISAAIVPLAEVRGWDQSTEGLILSSFYAGYILTQIPGGYLANRFGFKVVMGVGAVFTGLLSILVPFVSHSVPLVITARALAGISQGVLFPANANLLAHWFPVSQRSLATSAISSGGSVGTVMAMGLSPLIIDQLGWECVFYIAGGLLILFILPWWVVFASDNPRGHNSVTCLTTHPLEIAVIEQGKSPILEDGPLHRLQRMDEIPRKTVPWKALLLNPSVMAMAWHCFAGGWGWYVFLSWMPTYLQKELHFSSGSSGLIAFLPYLLRPLVNVISGALADGLVSRKILDMTTVRKIFQACSCIFPASLLIAIAYADLSAYWIAVLVIVSIVIAGLDGGVSGIIIDMGGEYSSVIFGFVNTLGSAPGIIGVYLTGYLLQVTHDNWSFVFTLAAAIWASAVLIFSIFAKSELIDTSEPPPQLSETTPLIA